jgi:uncharacterized protein with beta-barrel porin domain
MITITGPAAGAGIFVSGIAQFGAASLGGGISNSGTITGGGYGISVASIGTFYGGISNSGTIAVGGTGISVVSSSTFTGAIANSATISAGGNGILVASVAQFGSTSAGGGITNSGTISAGAAGIALGSKILGFLGPSTFAGGITNSGVITAAAGTGIYVAGVSTFLGNISNSGTITAKTGILIGSGVTFAGGAAIVNSGNITGSTAGAAIDVSGASSAVTIDQTAGTITGTIKLSSHADVLNISGGSIAGNIIGSGTQDVINFNLGSGTFTYGAAFGFGTISAVNVNSGIVILDGANSATNVKVGSGAALEVGDAANPSATLTSTNPVDVYGTLAGHGTVIGGATVESGGTLAPGGTIGTLTITGSLAFNAGSFYGIELSPTQHSLTLVNGTPGTVSINNSAEVELAPHLGNYSATTVAILTSTGTVSGTFDPTIAYVGAEKLNGATLTYDSHDVFLSYQQTFETLQVPAGATPNEQNIANAINNYILAGNTPPAGIQNLAFLSGPALLGALNQLTGEVATGTEQATFQLTNQFLGLMLDPFLIGRVGTGGGQATGFAPEQQTSLPPDIAVAYASILKAPPPASFDQRWSSWGSAYGGTSTTSGNAAVGSNTVTTGAYGFAAGMDYHLDPRTVLGFSLAGAGTNWNLAKGIGTGRSDAFQAGGYGVTWLGPVYLAGAVAFTNNWFTTNRSPLGDQLTANFSGQSFGARFETGYRYVTHPLPPVMLGVTPYGAVQVQEFRTPSFSETDVTGGGLGLAYNAMNATDTRTELGARFDAPTLLYGLPLVWRSRVAWAHDFVANPSLDAAFESLPGTSFTVNGAPIPQDSALASIGAQYFLTSRWSIETKFDGEFANGSQTYTGSGTLRYSW